MRNGALVILLGFVAGIVPQVADARPLEAAVPTCSANPGLVREASHGVTAGRVTITCPGKWSAFQGIQWYSGDPSSRGRWSFGGTRYVTGRGTMTIPHWTRPYHGTGWWRQVVKINGQSFIGPVSWLSA